MCVCACVHARARARAQLRIYNLGFNVYIIFDVAKRGVFTLVVDIRRYRNEHYYYYYYYLCCSLLKASHRCSTSPCRQWKARATHSFSLSHWTFQSVPSLQVSSQLQPVTLDLSLGSLIASKFTTSTCHTGPFNRFPHCK